jgi:uncharacterized phage-associated protein
MASTCKAAKTFCELSGWKMTNLRLQKLLYIAHMCCLGQTGNPLIDGRFEAWDFGPVEPTLYHKLKAFGNKEIPDIFACSSLPAASVEREIVASVHEQLKELSTSRLVAITHWDDGAWAKYYAPNRSGIEIPNNDICYEYAKRACANR